MVLIEKRGNRVIASGGPIPGVKQIPGSYYSDKKDEWTFPLSVETYTILRRRLGKNLKRGPELRAWVKAEKQKREVMARLADEADATLQRVPIMAPGLAEAMSSRTYQRVAARFIADGRRVLVADDQGLGKTLEIIGGILEAKASSPYLIVCPKSATETVWRRHIERWLPRNDVYTVPDGYAKREEVLNYFTNRLRDPRHRPMWLVINPAMAMTYAVYECKCGVQTRITKRAMSVLKCKHRKDRTTKKLNIHKHPALFDIEWGAIVMDECHDSLIAKSGIPTQTRYGLTLLDTQEDVVKVAASGTPMRDKPEQLWGVLNWIDPKQYSSKWNFIKTYWKTGGFSGWAIEDLDSSREKMLWDSLKPYVIRRLKTEVATDIPPKTYYGTPPPGMETPNLVWLPMEGKQARAYQQFVRDSEAKVRGGWVDAITPLAELIRRRQLASAYGEIRDGKFYPTLPSNKFEYLIQLLEELDYPKNPTTKVLVFSNQTRLLYVFRDALNQHFKQKICTTITGQTKQKLRSVRIRRFNEDDHRHVMLLNVKAGGSAITIDSADHSVFLDRSHIADLESQAEDRTHRVSNPRNVFYHYLVSEGTIDVGMSLLNAEKSEKTGRVLDTRREVQRYARMALELS